MHSVFSNAFFERQPQKEISSKYGDQDHLRPRNEIILGKLGRGTEGAGEGQWGNERKEEGTPP